MKAAAPPSGVPGAIGVPADEAAAETPWTSCNISAEMVDDDWATVSRRRQKRVWKPLNFTEDIDNKLEELKQNANRFQVLSPKLELPASEHDSDEESDMLDKLDCEIPEEDLERAFGPGGPGYGPAEVVKPSVKFLNMLGEIKAQSADINSVGEFVGRWERIRVNVDSGANVPVMAPTTGKLYSVEASEGSKNGTVYQAANGGTLPNLGQKFLPVVTKEGTLRGYSSQCADVTSTLQSVNHLNATGHGVWLDGKESWMVNKTTGEVNQIDHDGKNFTMDVWVVPPEELASVVDMVNTQGFIGHQP